MRLDIFLHTEKGLKSRSYAVSLIKNGAIKVNGSIVTKPAFEIFDGDEIEITQEQKYVSRGGEKLEKALEAFQIDVSGMTALDIGASTGGFTDCLLQHGAKKVFAVDVGTDQLDPKLRNDARVVSLEKTHIKDLAESAVEPPDIIVIDVSFISLRKVVPHLRRFCKENTTVIALFKPQFETGIPHKGVIHDEKLRARLLSEFIEFLPTEGFSAIGQTVSPIKGGDGNVEFLLHIKYTETKE